MVAYLRLWNSCSYAISLSCLESFMKARISNKGSLKSLFNFMHSCTCLSNTSLVLPVRQWDLCVFILARKVVKVLPVLVSFRTPLHLAHVKKYSTFLVLQLMWLFISHSMPLDVVKDSHSMMYPRQHS